MLKRLPEELLHIQINIQENQKYMINFSNRMSGGKYTLTINPGLSPHKTFREDCCDEDPFSQPLLRHSIFQCRVKAWHLAETGVYDKCKDFLPLFYCFANSDWVRKICRNWSLESKLPRVLLIILFHRAILP